MILPSKSNGHLHGISDGVDAGSKDQSQMGSSTVTWDSLHGWGDYLIDGTSLRPTINTIPSWYFTTSSTVGGS